jgi:hypothetical protein
LVTRANEQVGDVAPDQVKEAGDHALADGHYPVVRRLQGLRFGKALA